MSNVASDDRLLPFVELRRQLPRDKPLVVALSTFGGNHGGAAVVARRLHRCMADANGFECVMLVGQEPASDDLIFPVPRRKPGALKRMRNRIERSCARFPKEHYTHLSFNLSSRYEVPAVLQVLQPDLVHVHWIGSDFVTFDELAAVDAPMVWTLHDLWLLAGGEHYPRDLRYRTGYTRSNRPAGEWGFDLNRRLWQNKGKFLQRRDILFTAPSRWVVDAAAASAHLHDRRVELIPNAVDTDVFKPRDEARRLQLRAEYGVKDGDLLLLFGVAFSIANKDKGGVYFHDVLRALRRSGLRLKVAVFGLQTYKEVAALGIGAPVINIGFVNNNAWMADIYSMADVTVMPSVVETFGLTALESLACGTPVVCFDTSGLKDVVDHRRDGYRADCFDVGDLAAGIRWVLEDADRRLRLSTAGREKVLRNFRLDVFAQRFADCYAAALSGDGASS